MEEQQNSDQVAQEKPVAIQPTVLTQQAQPVQGTVPVFLQTQPKPEVHSNLSVQINRVSAFVLIMTAVFFAIISIMAIWQFFGRNTGDVVWRSFSSLATIGFAALIVNVATKLLDQYLNK